VRYYLRIHSIHHFHFQSSNYLPAAGVAADTVADVVVVDVVVVVAAAVAGAMKKTSHRVVVDGDNRSVENYGRLPSWATRKNGGGVIVVA